MKSPTTFNPSTHTIGIATKFENSPHGGEMHADGDEVLYLVNGRARVVFLDSPEEDIEMTHGRGLVVPKGMWHRVDILEPSDRLRDAWTEQRLQPLDAGG